MKGVHCSWVDILKIRQSLKAVEEDLSRLAESRCVARRTVEQWRRACDVIDVLETIGYQETKISSLEKCQPSHLYELGRHFLERENHWTDDTRREIADWVDLIEEKRLTVTALRKELRLARQEQASAGANAMLQDGVPGRPASVLLADPPWEYDFAETHDARSLDNVYSTAPVERILAHPSEPWFPPLAPDCVLFLWATAPKLREALAVVEGWGFAYKTHAVWDKEQVGMGYWFRGRHELLLVGTRGNVSPPDPDRRFASVFREKRDRQHSKKPVCVYEAIEAMFPDKVLAEAYQRGELRPRWTGAGNESAARLP